MILTISMLNLYSFADKIYITFIRFIRINKQLKKNKVYYLSSTIYAKNYNNNNNKQLLNNNLNGILKKPYEFKFKILAQYLDLYEKS
jgi:hypothetical protein